ncbi:MAG: methyltransferase [Halorubrum sp.]
MDEAAIRADMIEGLEHQIGEPLGASVLAALQSVPREAFVDDTPYANRASEEAGTRALAPATAARLVTALDADADDEVLVVGAGIGYTVALLAEIAGARHVHAVDIDRRAVTAARSNLSDAGYEAALVDRRDGATGLPEYAPYDRILVEAAVVTPPRALCEQLAPGGRIVYPRGTADQTIVAVEPADTSPLGDVDETPADDPALDGFETVETAGPVRLKPMLVDGEQAGVERNRTRREDAEIERQGHVARTGWEQEWIDWDDRL